MTKHFQIFTKLSLRNLRMSSVFTWDQTFKARFQHHRGEIWRPRSGNYNEFNLISSTRLTKHLENARHWWLWSSQGRLDGLQEEDRSPAGDPREVPDPRASISEQSPIMLEKQLPSGCISVSKTVSLCSKATVSSGSGNTGHFCHWCADTVPAYKWMHVCAQLWELGFHTCWGEKTFIHACTPIYS